MSGYTALLIGGPKSGETYALFKRDTLVIAEAPPLHEFPMSADFDEVVEFKKHYYEPVTFSFFGAPLRAWVHTSLNPPKNGKEERELGATLGAAILNPLGLTLLQEGMK